VDELLKLVNNLTAAAADNRRIFFEARFRNAREALSEAEETLKDFEESTGVVRIAQQAKAVLVRIATLEAQRAAGEVMLQVMKTYATSYNSDVKKAEAELNALKDQIKELKVWERMSISSTMNPVIAADRIPSLGIQYLRKQRELKLQEALYVFYMKMYENARLDEARESAPVQVVDKAVAPENIFKPKIFPVAVTATGAAFFLALFIVLSMAAIEKALADPNNRSKWEIVKQYFGLTRVEPCLKR